MNTIFGYWWVCLLGVSLLDATTQQVNAAVIDLDAGSGLLPPEKVSWVRLYGGFQEKTVRIGPDEMIYVVGTTEKESESYYRQYENKPDLSIPEGEDDLFLAKYDRSGKCHWFKTFGVEGFSDSYTGFEIDRFGNILIRVSHSGFGRKIFRVDGNLIDAGTAHSQAGLWRGILRFDLNGIVQEVYPPEDLDQVLFGPNGERYQTKLEGGLLSDVAELTKLDGAGNVVWTRSFKTPGGLLSLQLGSDGKIYSVGATRGFWAHFENDRPFVRRTGLLIARYSSEGWLEWYRVIESENLTSLNRFQLDSNNNVTVVGGFIDSLDLGQGTILEVDPSVRFGGFVIRLDSSGEVQWGHPIVSNRNVAVTGVAIDAESGVYVRGLKRTPDESFVLGFNALGEPLFSASTGVSFERSIAAFGPDEIYLSGRVATPDSSVPSSERYLKFGNWELYSRKSGVQQSYVARLGEMPLAILSHPLDVEIEGDGSLATFRVLSGGSDRIRYQWRRNGVPLGEGQEYFGVNTRELTVRSLRQRNEGMYDVVLTTDRESLTSEAAELSFTNLPPEFGDPMGIVLDYNRGSGPFEEAFDIEVTDPDGDTLLEWNLVFGLDTDEVLLGNSSAASNQLLINISGLEKNGKTARGFVDVKDQDGALLRIPLRVTFHAGDPTMVYSSRGRESGRSITVNYSISEDTMTVSESLTVEDSNLNTQWRNPETLKWRVAEEPSFGSLSLGTQAPSGSRISMPYEYTPIPNFNGDDSFVIEVTGNESEDWARAEVTVTVLPVNDAPEVVLPLRLGASNAEVGQVISPQMQDWNDLETDLRSIQFQYQWIINSSAGSDGARLLEGEDSPSLHVKREWVGQFIGVKVTAIDRDPIRHVPVGHTVDEGNPRAIFVYSEFVPVVDVSLPELNLENVPTSRLPLALDRRGVFLGGPWLLEEGGAGKAGSIRNLNNPELADPSFLQGAEWGLTGQEGVIWVRDAAMRSRSDFFNFTDLQESPLKLFSTLSGNVRGDHLTSSFLTGNGDYFVKIGHSLEHLNGLESAVRSGDFLNSSLEKISPDSTKALFYESTQAETWIDSIVLATFPELATVNGFELGLGIYNGLRKRDSVESPNQPVGWGIDPTGQRLLFLHGISRSKDPSPLANLPIVLGYTLMDLETGEVLGQRAMDFVRDRILFSWREHPLTSHPITISVNQNDTPISCFILARSLEDSDAALLEYRDWSSGELVQTVAVEDGVFHHGDFYQDSAIDPDREFWMYPSVVEPSLLLLDLATGEIVQRIEPFLDASTRGIAEVAVSQDSQLVTWVESTNPIDPVIPRISGVRTGFTAFHPRANGDVQGLVFDDLNENGRLNLSLIQSDEPHIVYVIDVSGSASDEFEGSEVGDVNGDEESNTILDAEIAAFQDFHRNLLAFGLGSSTKVAVVAFAENAVTYNHAGVVTVGGQMIDADSDVNGNQISDVIEALGLVRQNSGNVGSGTNFRSALQAARDVFAQSDSTPEQANVLFLSDGVANENNYTVLADDLRSIGINLRAIGVGEGSSLSGLKLIDPAAQKVFSTDELIAVFQPEEEPLPGVEVYADLNANGQYDPDEPKVQTRSDNPFTVSNEAGFYHIAGLSPGTVSIRLVDEAIQVNSVAEVEVKPVVRSRHLVAVRLSEDPVFQAPVITAQPAGVSVMVGESAILEVSVSGDGVLIFQWEKDGQVIDGATSNRYEIPLASLDHVGDYRVRIANEGGVAVSEVARLSVTSMTVDGPAGTNPLAWFRADSGVNTMGETVVAWIDETQSGLRLTPEGNGPVLVPNALNGNPAIAFDGDTQLGALLESGVLSEATVFALFRYTVPESDNDYLYTIGLPGAKGTQMSLSRLTGGFAYHYDGESQFLDGNIPSGEWLVASQIFGGAVSNQHQLFLNSELILSSTTETAYRVDPPQLILGNWSSGEFRFVGELAEFLIYDHTLGDNDRMAVETYLRDRVGIETPVDPPIAPPFILVDPVGMSVTEGEDVELLVAAQGLGELSYEWLFNGVPIPDETEARLRLMGVSSADEGSYRLRVSNLGGSVLSEPAEVVVEPVSSGNPVCPGEGGFVLFLNTTGPVLDLDGTFGGEDVRGQLYVGASENDLRPLCVPVASIGAGVFSGGEIPVPGFVGGAIVSVQVRAWKGAETFETAAIRGQSDIRTVRLKAPGDLIPAPSAETLAFQLQSVPQESTFAPIIRNGDLLTLQWTGAGKLQEATELKGPYIDSDNQSNPQIINLSQSERLFFRIFVE
jgi:hypothetical protein